MKAKLLIIPVIALTLLLPLSGCTEEESVTDPPAPVAATTAKMPQAPVATETTVPESADIELKTMELPLEDGTVLTLSVMGKQDADTGNCGIREVIVKDGTEIVQAVLIEEAIRSDGIDGIDLGYSECFSPEDSASLKDVNFDGIADLEVCAWIPNNSIPHYYWCWNPDMRQFEYAFCLQLESVDYENKQLIAWYEVENGLYNTDYYHVNAHNELELVDRVTEDVRPN